MIADGVTIHYGSTVTHVAPANDDGKGVLRLDNGPDVPFDALLVATGRAPRTGNLGLDLAGVDVDERGHIVADDTLRTSNQRVWAAGDVTGRSHHTHTAGVHGSLAASNAVLGLKRRINTSAVPRVTFTSPELAAVGVDTDEAEAQSGFKIARFDHAELDRAIAENERSGVTKLVIDRKGRIVGATVVGPRAGETLGELTLAIHQGMRARDLASVTHAYPTYNDAVWNAAVAETRRTLFSGFTGGALRLLGSIRRVWMRRRQA
jgi:pyruvate/2-oxoglutarate dehydrogenase complex dihydrolipoamide dehydrogenase (E3) component